MKLSCQYIKSKYIRSTLLCLILVNIGSESLQAMSFGTGTRNNLWKEYYRGKRESIVRNTSSKTIHASKFGNERVISSLSFSKDEQLKKISVYKGEIEGDYANDMMIFLNMPLSEAGIIDQAQNMKNIILEYKKNHVKPIFLFEPYDENHEEIDFKLLKDGTYPQALKKVFLILRDTYHISSDDIGILAPYPEINTPAYRRKSFLPKDFPSLVHSFFDSVREVYPEIHGGLLLDSKSYEIGKTWGQGSFSSLLPYIEGIRPGTIQLFGIQGFPWVSNDGKIKAYEPEKYLPLDITLEAAKTLGADSIWYNTGVMKKKYKVNTIYLSSNERDDILSATLTQAEKIKNQGFNVLINIFAQDKFQHSESTDWSFLSNQSDKYSLKKFLLEVKEKNIGVSIYDK